MVARVAGGLGALLLLGAILAWSLTGHGSPVSPTAAHADVTQGGYGPEHVHQIAHVSARAALTRPSTCLLVDRSTGYVNPLAGAKVKPERIDMGVDYAGSGPLSAIGAARITHLATEGTGWPGAFLEYQLLDGPDAGCHVYYAEGVTPKPGLKVGDRVGAGQVVATIIPQYPTGFEVGWGAGVSTKTYATVTEHWTDADDQHNRASRAGKNFSTLIQSTGGPPGKVEG